MPPAASLDGADGVHVDHTPAGEAVAKRSTHRLSHLHREDKAEARAAAIPWATSPAPRLGLHRSLHATRLPGSELSIARLSIAVTVPSGDSVPANESASDARPSSSSRKSLKTPNRPKSSKTRSKWSRDGTSSEDASSESKTSSDSTGSPLNPSDPAPVTAAARRRGQTNTASQSSAGHKGRLMAANFTGTTGDSRRGLSSPRPKGRGGGGGEAKSTFCRNVTIYGHCRYENTCPYVHDASLLKSGQNENVKKRFNVDSPSFTPLQPSTNGSVTPAARGAAISPKAANAAIFTPKSQRSTTSTPSLHNKEPTLDWHPQEFPEFVPGQNFDGQLIEPSGSATGLGYDPFNTSTLPSVAGSSHQASTINPYAQDPSGLSGTSYYQNAGGFQTSPAYHLYWPVGPQPTGLVGYQRTAHDFFIPDALREELQKKSEASRQVISNSVIPSVDHYHSLVCLDTAQNKNPSLFGYQSWVYKATSAKDGKTYALRRLQNFHLTNENAIRSVQPWKRVFNASVVTIHDAFTTRAFGDSSLIVVTDYHPCSKPLAEEHFKAAPLPARFHGRPAPTNHVSEQVLWGYIVQISSALKAIHSAGLAARLVTASKILVTSKNRIRLNACAIMDVVQFDNSRSLAELQADDLTQLGRLILCIANNSPTAHLSTNYQKSMDQITRVYTLKMKECVTWLLNPVPNPGTPTSPTMAHPEKKDVEHLLNGIGEQIAAVLDSNLHADDTLTNILARELESSRLVRLLIKLNFINERPELDASLAIPSGSTSNPTSSWAETGERYYLKLFRDYVFHQVDANGHPVTNLAHVLDCLNKLDAGSEEKIALISRDDQNVLVVTYRELKRGVDLAFQDLINPKGRTTGR